MNAFVLGWPNLSVDHFDGVWQTAARIWFMIRCRTWPVFAAARLFAVALSFSVLCPLISAQRAAPWKNASPAPDNPPPAGALRVNLFSESNAVVLDRQAVLKLLNLADDSVSWQTTDGAAVAAFNNMAYGNYQVEVSAVGYLPAQKQFQIVSSVDPTEIEIVLHRDRSALNLEGTSTMSAKARTHLKNATLLLKAGNLAQAQKQLDQAYKLAPVSADVNFLLGYLYFQRRDLTRAGGYLETAAGVSPHDPQILTLLGRTHLERQDSPAARTALEQAVMAAADDWLSHDLLANAYFQEKQYEKARVEAEIAIQKGKVAASPARLVLGESLFALGHSEDAVQALMAFLEEAPQHPIAPQVRRLLADTDRSLDSPGNKDSEDHSYNLDLLAALPPAKLVLKPWRPPGIDETKLSVAPEIGCPIAQVLEETGRHVEKLVQDVGRFAAIEELFHEALDDFGIPIRIERRKYNYVATISEPRIGILEVDERRAERLTSAGYPDRIASTGFAALALVFHPHRRDSFEVSCEGLSEWHGEATWLVRFQQRSDRPNYMHSYEINHQIYPVALRGRAWITADNFQIVRIEAEMVRPMPEIQLLSEHQIVEYGAIPFPKKQTTLWLPKSAEIYFEFRKRRYHRRHSFEHYMLFSVDSGEERKEPAVLQDATSPEQ
jgi:tetratricopeptide (TPR) repeat protein